MTRYVVKIGGHAVASLTPDNPVLVALADDLAQLRQDGIDVVVVHGGGPQINALLEATGEASEFRDGLRVTTPAAMEFVAMALSQVNLHLVAAFNHAGLNAVGLSGADGSLLRATALALPWGRVASAIKVSPDILETLFASGVTPVVSCLAVDDTGDFVNCNADAAAGALAGAVDADQFILLSDVDQLRRDADDASTALAHVSASDVHELIASGAAKEGMKPKMTAALDALSAGASRVVLANGMTPHALRDVLAGSLRCTEVVA